jgi:hypothetical protein
MASSSDLTAIPKWSIFVIMMTGAVAYLPCSIADLLRLTPQGFA